MGHYRTNWATPWPIVKRFGDNALTDLEATEPRGPDISRKLPISAKPGYPQCFVILHNTGGGRFFSFHPTPHPEVGAFKVRNAPRLKETSCVATSPFLFLFFSRRRQGQAAAIRPGEDLYDLRDRVHGSALRCRDL
jgi:hypothetical protein